ncbi:hypothetical protein C0J52_04433 [Blattella germanica]|nr:hypothetical protein C0J52_04433 [Blattella germanica]
MLSCPISLSVLKREPGLAEEEHLRKRDEEAMLVSHPPDFLYVAHNPASVSCSLGYRDTDDTMGSVQLRGSSSSTDPISSSSDFQDGFVKRGMATLLLMLKF